MLEQLHLHSKIPTPLGGKSEAHSQLPAPLPVISLFKSGCKTLLLQLLILLLDLHILQLLTLVSKEGLGGQGTVVGHHFGVTGSYRK